MIHVGEGAIQAYLDEALAEEERGEVARHLAACTACAGELELLRRAAESVAMALARLDRPPRLAEALASLERRRRGSGNGGLARAFLRAATLVLGFAAAGAAALPGSPVRHWVAAAWAGAAARLVSGPAIPAAPRARAAAAEPDPGAATGVSIEPVDGRARIVIEGAAAGARLRVRVVEGERVAVLALGAAADARFRTGLGRVEVVGGGPGELRIELARAIRHATVEMDGRILVAKEGEVLKSLVAAENTGAEVLLELLAR